MLPIRDDVKYRRYLQQKRKRSRWNKNFNATDPWVQSSESSSSSSHSPYMADGHQPKKAHKK